MFETWNIGFYVSTIGSWRMSFAEPLRWSSYRKQIYKIPSWTDAPFTNIPIKVQIQRYRCLKLDISSFMFWLPSLIARRWVGRQTQWWPRHKAIYFSWFGPELFCLLLGPPGFNCWFSSAPVFQWCCSTPQGSPGVGRNTFLSSPHLCFIIVFICDLFVSRDDPLMS